FTQLLFSCSYCSWRCYLSIAISYLGNSNPLMIRGVLMPVKNVHSSIQ
uniref:Uncharacterized protein n=1 Tax=Aegilops tauschii subsp. strangulata TaxID=200361 RepID=A0A453Q095_AEGTS